MPPIHLLNRIVSFRLMIPLLLFLSGCYPIEDSPTAPAMPGEATVTIGEDEYTASAQHMSRPGKGSFESIKMKLENNGALSIFHIRFQPGVSTIRLNDTLSDQIAGAIYSKTKNVQFTAYSGKIRIEETTPEHIKGNFELEMKRVPVSLLPDNSADDLISLYGEFYAVR
ncbi:MAG: hypothetical protein GF372_14585 [Candidatus Marinimicrobia bacterium]|nr:hypothetical protein [Candidatus Neomarinimicrobiota bacterium]